MPPDSTSAQTANQQGLDKVSLTPEEAVAEIHRILEEARMRIEELHQEQNKVLDEYREKLTQLRINTISQQLDAPQ